MWGQNGNDELDGDDGDDRIAGGAGRDELEGGSGVDFLEFERGDGRDRITAFQNGTDRIELDDFSRAQVSHVIGNARQQGTDVVLVLDANTSVIIEDMQRGQLDLSDFTF